MNNKPSVGRTIWGSIYPILIFVGVDTLISYVAMFILAFKEVFAAGPVVDFNLLFEDVYNNTINQYMENALYFTLLRSVAVIPVFFVLMHKDVKKDVVSGRHIQYEKFNKAWLLLIIPIGMFACIGFNNLVMIIAELAQDFIDFIIDKLNLGLEYDIMSSFNETSEIIYSGGIVIQLLTTCVCAPLVEELLFRGLVHKRLRRIMNVTPAMLISSLLFGIIHGNIIQGIYAFLIGMICAYVYEKFKSIWAPIILHASANTLAVLSTYMVTSSENTEGVGLSTGGYMLYTVLILAGAFGLLFLLEKKFDRKEIPKVENFTDTMNEQGGI